MFGKQLDAVVSLPSHHVGDFKDGQGRKAHHLEFGEYDKTDALHGDLRLEGFPTS
ncbi:hypothetical protein D3C71_2058440 [compost metagenome]